MKIGDTYLSPCLPGFSRHCFVIITEPDKNQQAVVICFNTERPTSDFTVRLEVGSHEFIKVPSVAGYQDAQIVDVKNIRADRGLHKPLKAVTPEILKKIQDGVLVSKRTPREVKKYFQTRLSEGGSK